MIFNPTKKYHFLTQSEITTHDEAFKQDSGNQSAGRPYLSLAFYEKFFDITQEELA